MALTEHEERRLKQLTRQIRAEGRTFLQLMDAKDRAHVLRRPQIVAILNRKLVTLDEVLTAWESEADSLEAMA